MGISINQFGAVEMKVGKILSAEEIPEADKLLKLSVDFGEVAPRQVLSGIKQRISIERLIGMKAVFVTNLEPRTIRGLESQAMIMTASTMREDGTMEFTIIGPIDDVPVGSIIS